MADEQNKIIKIIVEAPSGELFEAEIPCGTKVGKVAVDFFEAQGWPLQDRWAGKQRAVVELVNPQNPDSTKRLNGEVDICEAGVVNGARLRIFPEVTAGGGPSSSLIDSLPLRLSNLPQEIYRWSDRSPVQDDLIQNILEFNQQALQLTQKTLEITQQALELNQQALQLKQRALEEEQRLQSSRKPTIEVSKVRPRSDEGNAPPADQSLSSIVFHRVK